MGALELRGWGPIDPRHMISRVFSFIAIHWVIHAISCFCICFEATSIGNKCVYPMELLVQCLSKNGLVYTFRILVDTMIHRSESIKKDWMTGSVHSMWIRFLKKFLTGIHTLLCESSRQLGVRIGVKKIREDMCPIFYPTNPTSYSKDLLCRMSSQSTTATTCLWYTLYSPYYHRVSHGFC